MCLIDQQLPVAELKYRHSPKLRVQLLFLQFTPCQCFASCEAFTFLSTFFPCETDTGFFCRRSGSETDCSPVIVDDIHVRCHRRSNVHAHLSVGRNRCDIIFFHRRVRAKRDFFLQPRLLHSDGRGAFKTPAPHAISSPLGGTFRKDFESSSPHPKQDGET